MHPAVTLLSPFLAHLYFSQSSLFPYGLKKMPNVVSQHSTVPHCCFPHWLLPSVSQTATEVVQILPHAPFLGDFYSCWGHCRLLKPRPSWLIIPFLQGSAFSSAPWGCEGVCVGRQDISCSSVAPVGLQGILLSSWVASAEPVHWKCLSKYTGYFTTK